MLPIVSVVGRSDSGKTTLIEKLIPELLKRGYRVGTIKHHAHPLELDKQGKDSWRHAKAGAAVCMVAGSSQILLTRSTNGEMDVRLLAGLYMDEVDLLITEGYKKKDFPKIEVHRQDSGEDLLCGPDDNLFAVVSDADLDCPAPRLGTTDIKKLADLLEDRFLRKEEEPRVTLIVDDRPVSLKPFLRDMLSGAVRGLIRALRGCEEAVDVQIKVRD